MSKFTAWLIVILFFAALKGLEMLFDSADTPSKPKKSKEEIHENAPNKIKCKCLECNQVVMIPKQYLNDLTYRGPQTSKCPNCDWKMRKVRIIQEWGLD